MPTSREINVLIVDDYNTQLRILRTLLERLGFANVDEANDGDTALGKLREKDYGLVISDWDMEPMTGLELLNKARATGCASLPPFLMLTPESKAKNIADAKCLGLEHYLTRPFDARAFGRKLQSVLGPL